MSGVVVAQIKRSASFGRVPGFFQQSADSLGGHMRGAKALTFQNMPFFDARTLRDPCITRVHHAGKLRICEQIGRQVAMDGGNRGTRGQGQR